MAASLGLDEYAVFGLSGGGPFAVATAVADPGRVRALGVVAGIGPWRLIDDDLSRDPGGRMPRLLDAGDVTGAWDCMSQDAERAYRGSTARDAAARVDAILAEIADGSRLSTTRISSAWATTYESSWELDGSFRDNLAWGAAWDIDPRDVAAPTRLWYGELGYAVSLAHGRWYADRIAGSELVILPGEGTWTSSMGTGPRSSRAFWPSGSEAAKKP